jgi:hypothetical protein
MTLSDDNIDDCVEASQATRLGRLLEQLDAIILSTGRAIGQVIVDGLADYAMSHCAPLGVHDFRQAIVHRAEHGIDPMAHYGRELAEDGGGRTEIYDDTDVLIHVIQAMEV